MAADVSSITYFAPIAAFLLVFIVIFAVLYKLELVGENRWVQLFVSFLIASIFVSAAGTKDYVLTVVPWIAVLIITLFFILLLLGFVGKEASFMNKGVGIATVIILALVFLVSAFVVFNDVLLLPFTGPGADTPLESAIFFDWLYSSRVVGAIVLILASLVVSWILVKTSKDK